MNYTFTIGQIQALPITAEFIAAATWQDTVLSHVLKFVKEGWPSNVSEAYVRRKHKLSTDADCLLWGGVLYVWWKVSWSKTRKPLSFEISELLFADDGVITSCTRPDVEEAAHMFDEVAAEWGLTVSVIKTKLLIASWNLEKQDFAPLYIHGQLVEQEHSFKYLGSFVEAHGCVLLDVQGASQVFGALRHSVFHDGSLSLSTKRMVYCSMVLGVLLYGIIIIIINFTS